MEQELQRIKAEALDAIKDAADQQALQDIRVKYLGKKGEVTALLKGLGKLSPEERPKAGALVNAIREALEAEIDTVKARMETACSFRKRAHRYYIAWPCTKSWSYPSINKG